MTFLELLRHSILFLTVPYITKNPQSNVTEPEEGKIASAPDKTVLFQVATVMIQEAGADDFAYLSQAELDEMGLQNSVMWKSEALGVTSGVFLSEIEPSVDLRTLSSAAVQSFMASCEGDAATSSSDASSADLPAREVRVICKTTDSGTDTFFRQMVIGDKLLETVTIFDGSAASSDQDEARSSLRVCPESRTDASKGALAARYECRFQPDALIVSRERPVGRW